MLKWPLLTRSHINKRTICKLALSVILWFPISVDCAALICLIFSEFFLNVINASPSDVCSIMFFHKIIKRNYHFTFSPADDYKNVMFALIKHAKFKNYTEHLHTSDD